MKKITENAALHPNEDPLLVFRVVDGVILQVASGPVAGSTPTSSPSGRTIAWTRCFKLSQPPWSF
jgi:hypothetical protein